MNTFVRTYRKKNTSFAGLPRRTRGFSGLSSPSVALLQYKFLDRQCTNAFICHRHGFCWFELRHPHSHLAAARYFNSIRCDFEPDFHEGIRAWLTARQQTQPTAFNQAAAALAQYGWPTRLPSLWQTTVTKHRPKKSAALENNRNTGLLPNDQHARSPLSGQSQRRLKPEQLNAPKHIKEKTRASPRSQRDSLDRSIKKGNPP